RRGSIQNRKSKIQNSGTLMTLTERLKTRLPHLLDYPQRAGEPWTASDWMLAWYDRYRWIYFALMIAIYLMAFSGQWRPEPDAALYLEIGRNIAEGEGYTYHGQAHALAYPGLPWLWAGIFALFGAESLWPHHAVMLGFAMVGLG